MKHTPTKVLFAVALAAFMLTAHGAFANGTDDAAVPTPTVTPRPKVAATSTSVNSSRSNVRNNDATGPTTTLTPQPKVADDARVNSELDNATGSETAGAADQRLTPTHGTGLTNPPPHPPARDGTTNNGNIDIVVRKKPNGSIKEAPTPTPTQPIPALPGG